jgi:integrase
MRMALKLVLVTGQRPGEIIGMTWDDIHDEVWVIPEHRHKTEDGQRVPLTPLALELVEAIRGEQERLAKRREALPEHLFTKGENAYTVNALSRAVKRNVKLLGNKDREPWGHWTPHDLRRTMRTGLSALKIPEHIAERVIGHRPQGVVAVYDQHRYEPEKRAALEAWERRLRGIVDNEPADNVVPIASGGERG